MDRGAWWAAVHGVAGSRTKLKQLSMHACIGEGNGSPLQYSRLENPRDGRVWWGAVYGVAQSRTRLKRLSSSSSSSSSTFLNFTIHKYGDESIYFVYMMELLRGSNETIQSHWFNVKVSMMAQCCVNTDIIVILK